MSGHPLEWRNTAGIRFEPHGRTIEYEVGELRLQQGDLVVVEERGRSDVGTVSAGSARRSVRGLLGRVLRHADASDKERLAARDRQVLEALAYARDRARYHDMPIKVFRIEMPRGSDKATVFFSSEQRIDFRALVRDLAAHLHLRVELRQVGVRDEAKLVGGIGSCGRELCCTTFLPRFAPVSIRSAKNQNLVLNPIKVTGQCGRLKCCLVYEEATYVEAARALPRLGKRVETPEGVGRVEDLDVLQGRIRVSFPDRPPQVFLAAEVRRILAPEGGTGAGADGGGADEAPGENPGDGSPRS